MTTLQFTFIGRNSRESFTVVGTDQKDASKIAFGLVSQLDTPRAVICKPVHLAREAKLCAA